MEFHKIREIPQIITVFSECYDTLCHARTRVVAASFFLQDLNFSNVASAAAFRNLWNVWNLWKSVYFVEFVEFVESGGIVVDPEAPGRKSRSGTTVRRFV